jgi:hypothetical protein
MTRAVVSKRVNYCCCGSSLICAAPLYIYTREISACNYPLQCKTMKQNYQCLLAEQFCTSVLSDEPCATATLSVTATVTVCAHTHRLVDYVCTAFAAAVNDACVRVIFVHVLLATLWLLPVSSAAVNCPAFC